VALLTEVSIIAHIIDNEIDAEEPSMELPLISYEQLSEDYLRVERAITFLEKHFDEQPSLKAMAESAGLSEFHFQRLFSRWVGISPKRFMQYLTKERAAIVVGIGKYWLLRHHVAPAAARSVR
jgi:hypothetical protein